MSFYTFEEIKKRKDINGKKPLIYIVSTNRSGGKTTAFLKMAFEDNIEKEEECVLFYRKRTELTGSEKIFEEMICREYPEQSVSGKMMIDNLIYQIWREDEHGKKPLGYAVAFKGSDDLKKYSPIFQKVTKCLLDEFQKEDGRYLKDECSLLLSAYTSISRGQGKQSRPVELYLLGNNISILNPYYFKLGITKRLKKDTKFMRGDGWVLEQGFNASASKALGENSVIRALSGKRELNYLLSKEYLIDVDKFITNPSGKSRYLCTIIYDEIKIGVREFENGEIHCNNKVDPSSLYTFAFTDASHSNDTVILRKGSFLWKTIRDGYDGAYLTFSSHEIKNVIFELIGVDMYA